MKYFFGFIFVAFVFPCFANDIIVRLIDGKEIEGRIHPNGGGFVALTADVAETVFVEGNALVLDNAKVSDNARVYGQVSGDAEVWDNAEVYGRVSGTAKLSGYVHMYGQTNNARLTGSTLVHTVYMSGDYVKAGELIHATRSGLWYGPPSAAAEVSDSVKADDIIVRLIDGKKIEGRIHLNGGGFVALTADVAETAFVGENALVLDNAKVSGNARVYSRVSGNAKISGSAPRVYGPVSGDTEVSGNAQMTFYLSGGGVGILRLSDDAVLKAGTVYTGDYVKAGELIHVTRSGRWYGGSPSAAPSPAAEVSDSPKRGLIHALASKCARIFQ